MNMGQSTPGALCPTVHSSSQQFIKCPVSACSELVVWYARLLHVALCILVFIWPNSVKNWERYSLTFSL